jgi:hypothetical protein
MILERLEQGLVMHPAILGIAVGSQLTMLVADQVPKLNVEATCKGSVAADKAMGLMLPQGFDKCMSDENSAQQQLVPIWSSYSAAIRAQCEGEATAAGSASFSAMCGMSFLLWAKAADKSRSETTLRKGLSP